MLRLGRLDLPSADERFWSKVDKTEGCWNWQGATTLAGYSSVSFEGGRQYGHRYSYELVHGPLGEGQVVDHMCHNKVCVNPEHLRAVTQSENGLNRRGPKAGSKSGAHGVAWDSGRGKWYASITLEGKSISAGRHNSIREAEAAVKALRTKLGVVVTGTGRAK